MLVHIPCFQRLGVAIIITYAPSSNASPEDHATYYTNLETLIAKVRPRFTLLIAGDFNAEVGTRSPETGNALGPHGPSHRTNCGLQLCQFCNEHGLAVANTWTPQRTKATWWHPRFGTSHLIDFFLIPHAHIGNTHRVLTISPDVARTAHLGEWTPYTDHNPVEITIKMAPPKGIFGHRTLPPRPATYKARGKSQQAIALRTQFHQAITHKIQTHTPCQTWDEIASLLTTTSAEVFGFTESQGGKPWFAERQNEIKRLNSHVSTAKHNLIACTQAARDQPYNPDAQRQQQLAKQSLNTAKRVKRRLFTQWERDYWHTIGQQAEDAETRGDTYALYSLFSKLKVRKANSTRSSLHNVSRNPFAEAESWKDHFSKIQNGAVPVAERVWDSVPINPIPAQWLNDTPTTPELTRALAKMKIGKAPGDDGVTVEMLKWAPQQVMDNLFTFTQHLWNTTCSAPPDTATVHWPESWMQATVIPLWKQKHPKSNKNNWRGVTLLSIGVKLISRIVASRIQQFSESFMDEEQQGFRRNRGVDDVLQVSRRIAEEICSSRGTDNVKLTLYDIEKAYPRINREALWSLLQKRGAPLPFLQVCKALHNHTQFHIKLPTAA